jgi:hypothetical protein
MSCLQRQLLVLNPGLLLLLLWRSLKLLLLHDQLQLS